MNAGSLRKGKLRAATEFAPDTIASQAFTAGGITKALTFWWTMRKSEWKSTGPLGSASYLHRVKRNYLDATVELVEKKSGILGPQWCEALMGWPEEWTDLVNVKLAKRSIEIANGEHADD